MLAQSQYKTKEPEYSPGGVIPPARASGSLRSDVGAGTTRVGVVQQPDDALDVIPGLLDLPETEATTVELERYVKTLALFYDRIIVPDGWLHCRGPVSEYMRSQLRLEVEARPGRPPRRTWASRAVITQLMEREILVPALRGERPTAEQPKIVGFDLLDTWRNGRQGVKPGRLAILPQDDDGENEMILDALSSSTRLFADWNAPWMDIAASYDHKPVVAHWDRLFADRSVSRIGALPDMESVNNAFHEWAELGLAPDASTVPAVPAVHDYCEQLIAAFRARRGTSFRRGDIEADVAQPLGIMQLRSYRALKHLHGTSSVRIDAPNFLGFPDGVDLRALFGQTLLDRITTVQEGMFAEKFSCGAGMCRYYSVDLINDGFLQSIGLEMDTSRLAPDEVIFAHAPIAIERLTIEAIVDLRTRYLSRIRDAVREIKKTQKEHVQLWTENKEVVRTIQEYVHAIADSVDLSDNTQGVILKGIRGVGAVAGGTVGLFASKIAVLLSLGGFGGPLVLAGSLVVPLGVILGGATLGATAAARALATRQAERALKQPLEHLVQNSEARSSGDMTLRLLGIAPERTGPDMH